MAKCRNCCKEVDPNATICPYCKTGMPANDYVAKFKAILIGVICLGFVGFLAFYLISLFKPLFIFIGAFLFIVGIFAFINAIKSKKEEHPEFDTKKAKGISLILILIGIVLIIICFAS